MKNTISNEKGTLSIVSTPIGNLEDFTFRAKNVLQNVDVILAEDTRHSAKLLSHYGINTPVRSCHQHNEQSMLTWLSAQLDVGQNIALISDAGTPLISDPGCFLVQALRQQKHMVKTVPGASAVIAALSVSGLSTQKWIFDGFLPAKQMARIKQLKSYIEEPRTVALYESSHRIIACLQDCETIFATTRKIVLAKELTKQFETICSGSASSILSYLFEDERRIKGEFVLMIGGGICVPLEEAQIMRVFDAVYEELGETLPLKKISQLVAKITSQSKNAVYAMALRHRLK